MAEKGTIDATGVHGERLQGLSHKAFFRATEKENLVYPDSVEVDADRTVEFDAADLETNAVNVRIRELMREGYGHIIVRNPGAKHSLGVGILNRLKLEFDGSLGTSGSV